MKLTITDARIWYLYLVASALAGLALAMNVKPLHKAQMNEGCAPTYCVA